MKKVESKNFQPLSRPCFVMKDKISAPYPARGKKAAI